ncbi:LD-carboxypeptidase [Candidatus Woesearchaeota archaeon]|nr:LD-carboxypeptidase [Candidatus Woesearchaeota archaeon]
MLPPKLKVGDEIRVITPARSRMLPWIQNIKDDAHEKLESMGFTVTYGKHVDEMDEFGSTTIEHRMEDLHDAFSDKNVKAVLTVIGGFNSNQLLRHLDYDLIRANPKILCGYSDITALQNAIYTKTGMVTYSGPHWFTFGDKKSIVYTEQKFRECLMQEGSYRITPSREWSDDRWANDQENRSFTKNEGYWVLNEGSAEGTIVGANLCTFNLLQGTEYKPSLKDTILFLEDDHESQPHHFDRNLQSVLHQNDFSGVKGIVTGRFQNESNMTKEILTSIVKTKKELDNIPIIANVDFGHTTPMAAFPIGGKARITANKDYSIEILEH